MATAAAADAVGSAPVTRPPALVPPARRRRALALALAPALLALACHGAEPVARLASDTQELSLPHGRHAGLRLRWEPLQDQVPGTVPVVFLHLLDAQRNIVRTFDHDLPSPWKNGQELADPVGIYHTALGPALPPGEYELTGGLY